MPRVSSSNKRLDPESFKQALASGLYQNAGGARRALGKSKIPKGTKKVLYGLIDQNQNWKANSAKKRAGAASGRKTANLKGRAKGVHRSTAKQPFVVLFFNTASAGKDDLLDFLRGAADHGMTLPALIEALESCG